MRYPFKERFSMAYKSHIQLQSSLQLRNVFKTSLKLTTTAFQWWTLYMQTPLSRRHLKPYLYKTIITRPGERVYTRLG